MSSNGNRPHVTQSYFRVKDARGIILEDGDPCIIMVGGLPLEGTINKSSQILHPEGRIGVEVVITIRLFPEPSHDRVPAYSLKIAKDTERKVV